MLSNDLLQKFEEHRTCKVYHPEVVEHWDELTAHRARAFDAAPAGESHKEPDDRQTLRALLRALRACLTRRKRADKGSAAALPARDDDEEEKGEAFGRGAAKGAIGAVGGPVAEMAFGGDDLIGSAAKNVGEAANLGGKVGTAIYSSLTPDNDSVSTQDPDDLRELRRLVNGRLADRIFDGAADAETRATDGCVSDLDRFQAAAAETTGIDF
jgi:hypothetical protein